MDLGGRVCDLDHRHQPEKRQPGGKLQHPVCGGAGGDYRGVYLPGGTRVAQW
ncbi:hypothetical protein D3C78_1899620 [compost metagenome]